MQYNKPSSFLIGLSACVFASLSHAASILPLIPYNPYAPLPFQFRAGLDFNDSVGAPGSLPVTQPGFLGVPESDNKTYSLSQNGISIGIQVRNANQPNQNRWRGSLATAGALMNDFEQWFGNIPSTPVEATFSLSGLQPSTPYFLEFYHTNIGCCDTTLTFYNGTSTAVAALIGTNSTNGGPGNYATWEPGTIIKMSSDINGELDITAQSGSDGRLTLAGFAISVPEPSHSILLGLGTIGIILRRRR